MRIFVCLLLYILSFNLHAAAKCLITNATYIKTLDKRYVSEGLRIFYTLNKNSPDAVADLTDTNINGVPDYVENISIQFNTSRKALNRLGFRDPLQSPRYKGVASFIDIHIRNIASYGSALEVPRLHTANPLKENKCALIIKIKNNLDTFPDSWPVVHYELFHLYEYGYTQFKAPWFMEAISTWSEGLIRLGAVKNAVTPLPQTALDTNRLVFNQAYNLMWDRLAVIADKSKGELILPPELIDARYVKGEKVFKDSFFRGYVFIRKVLENLSMKSYQVSGKYGRDPYNWTEVDQRDTKYDKLILQAAYETLLQFDKTNAEANTFFKAGLGLP